MGYSRVLDTGARVNAGPTETGAEFSTESETELKESDTYVSTDVPFFLSQAVRVFFYAKNHAINNSVQFFLMKMYTAGIPNGPAKSMFRIRTLFLRIRIQIFFFNTEPDSGKKSLKHIWSRQ